MDLLTLEVMAAHEPLRPLAFRGVAGRDMLSPLHAQCAARNLYVLKLVDKLHEDLTQLSDGSVRQCWICQSLTNVIQLPHGPTDAHSDRNSGPGTAA